MRIPTKLIEEDFRKYVNTHGGQPGVAKEFKCDPSTICRIFQRSKNSNKDTITIDDDLGDQIIRVIGNEVISLANGFEKYATANALFGETITAAIVKGSELLAKFLDSINPLGRDGIKINDEELNELDEIANQWLLAIYNLVKGIRDYRTGKIWDNQ